MVLSSITPVWALVVQLLIAGAGGAVVGSFLNVVVLRTKAKKNWLTGRSKCPRCGRVLRWWELIPVGSFLAIGGRCRTCRRQLSLQYLILECLTATMFMIVFLRFGWTWQTLLGWVIGAAMIIIATYDQRWSLIPDEFSYLLIGAALLWTILAGESWLNIVYGLLIGGGFFGLQFLASRGKWVGSGDIFLGVGLGLLLGWRNFLVALVMAYLVGAIFAVVMLIRRQTKIGRTMPFGPFLMAAGFAAWLGGAAIVNWYLLHVIQF